MFIYLLLVCGFVSAQDIEQQIKQKQSEIAALQSELSEIRADLEKLKFLSIKHQLKEIGYPEGGPSGEVVTHKAMVLNYVEEHEQASWVFHIIMPEVKDGNVSRTNDFRIDPYVSTGTAEEVDYFLKYKGDDGKYEYDGFGYDRGHLAPSADFRWSKEALSESYFYSNMSPQYPEFNRGVWAQLEGSLRGYVIRTGHPLYVVTGGILEEDLPKVKRAKNHLTIPQYFYKVAYDPESNISIGFLIKNHDDDYKSWSSYAVTVDKVEEETGIDFFSALENDDVEGVAIINDWLSSKEKGNKEPLEADELPRNTYNTYQARYHVDKGRPVRICGHVVSTHKSGKGNVFLNLDKKFPNQVFSVTIWKKDMVNFTYEPHVRLINQLVCVKGKIGEYKGVPTMNVKNEEAIEINPDLD